MRRSAGPERRREVERGLERLARAVDEIAERMEVESGTRDPATPDAGFDARLEALEVQNRRLRDTLARAKGKAERLRTRLALVEDEI